MGGPVVAADHAGQAWLEQALAAQARGAWLEAARAYGQLTAAHPGDHRLVCNQGNVLWLADRPGPARACFQRAIGLAPAEGLPWRGLGNAERDRLRFGAAASAYRRSASLQPDPLTAWNLSQVLLGLERYREAFALAEQRLLLPALEPYRGGAGWDGRYAALALAASRGQRLHLWSEQGLGDTLQFLRWLEPLLSRWRADWPPPLLEVEPPLVDLLRQGLGWLPAPVEVRAKRAGEPEPAALHCSLLSLPHRLGCWRPPRRRAWLELPAKLPAELPAATGRPSGPRVGVLWAAGRKLNDSFTAREYRKRSLPPSLLGALLEGLAARGAELVALQHGADREQVAPWRHLLMAELPADADFLRTATWLDRLDLVITVDTAMAHLVGCLGRPAWVLLPRSADPRWLRGRADSVWYPSLKLFRQPRGGAWEPLLAAVLAAFEAGPIGSPRVSSPEVSAPPGTGC